MSKEPRTTKIRSRLADVYQNLHAHFGPQHWWPGDTPLEVMVGAVLTQNTAWINVEKAISNLKQADVLRWDALPYLNRQKLETLIRPSGFFRQKAERLQNFLRFLLNRYRGDVRAMSRRPATVLRAELLEQKGIGPETADSILLYALQKPVFVVDAYTRRLLRRWGLLATDDYDTIQQWMERHVPRRASLYNEWHALIVALAKTHCRTKPLCVGCPVRTSCRHGRSHGH